MKVILIKQSDFDDVFTRHIIALKSWLKGKHGVTDATWEHVERIVQRIKRDIENGPPTRG